MVLYKPLIVLFFLFLMLVKLYSLVGLRSPLPSFVISTLDCVFPLCLFLLLFCADYTSWFFYVLHPSVVILPLRWFCSAQSLCLIGYSLPACQWFSRFLFIIAFLNSLALCFSISLPHCLQTILLCLLADSSRLQAGQAMWVFDMAHKAEGHDVQAQSDIIFARAFTDFASLASVLHQCPLT